MFLIGSLIGLIGLIGFIIDPDKRIQEYFVELKKFSNFARRMWWDRDLPRFI
ncbi:MAG: hypothetical protein K2N03_01420 [Muribaculaceae bacterium]|nr:hypothetical protein [Muribaculaceae bacterium]